LFISPLRVYAVVASATLIGGCGAFGGGSDPEPGSREALQLPPRLELERDQTALSIPEKRSATASASGGEQVLPELERVDVKRAGTDRWLEVSARPNEVWGWLARFLERKGIKAERKRAEAGILESEWVYTQKPLTRGAFAPRVESREEATAADRYLFRVEAAERSGRSEVFVAHRRVARRDNDRWQLLPRDPFLEAEVLRSLAVFLGSTADDGVQQLAGAPATGTGAELVRADSGELSMRVPNAFPDAWRRVGVALDRAAFTVLERNRGERYVDLRFDTDRSPDGEDDDGGVFDSIAFWSGDDADDDSVRRLRLTFQEQGRRSTELRLMSPDDEPLPDARREEILGVLADQVR